METGIGKRIKERRLELGLSQDELAKRIGLKSKSTICKIERGEDNLTSPTLQKYAKALNTTSIYLMYGKQEHPIDTEEAKAIRDLYTNVDAEILEAAENDPQLKEFIQLFMHTAPDDRPAVLQILKGLQRNS